MKVLVAGAAGALGQQLVPQLVAAGHDVVGMTRSESKAGLVRSLGARPAIADALDPDQVAEAVASAEPDAIAHELTALSGEPDMRHWDRYFELTNRLRTEGTDNLLAAARAVGGVKRFVIQSYAGWPYERSGAQVKTEDDPLDPSPAKEMSRTLDAIRRLERTVLGADFLEGVVLRYGGFYGPGTSFWATGEVADQIRARKFPVVGEGTGVWSFIRIEDAAQATLLALEHGERGVYNVVDDEPVRVSEWLPAAAEALGAKPPRHVPLWLGRMLAGEVAAIMMTEVRGASNEKAKRELGWQPEHPSWRDGFRELASARAESAAEAA